MIIKKKQVVVLILISSLILTGCLSFEKLYHKTTKYGEIIEINDQEIIFCIGDRAFAELGKEFKTYRKGLVRFIPAAGGRHGITNTLTDHPVETGTIRIVEYRLDYYARGIIVKGVVSKDDEVDINRVWN